MQTKDTFKDYEIYLDISIKNDFDKLWLAKCNKSSQLLFIQKSKERAEFV